MNSTPAASDLSPLDPARLAPVLQAYIGRRLDPASRIADLKVMEQGHAGLTFGFDVVNGGGLALASYILKLAPPGVRRLGNTDVYRQAPLLRALHRAGLPVPDVPFAEPDEADLGTPFIIMQRLPGRCFIVWEPEASFEVTPAKVASYYLRCTAVLADLHRFDWRRELANWEAPRPLAEEILRWDGVLAKAPEPAWIEAGRRVRELLLARIPDGEPVGLVHGDFQPGNALWDGDRLAGIIDWELSSIGAQLADLGWLMMFADRANWHPDWTPAGPPPEPAEIQFAYEEAMGRRFRRVAWYQALAGYRLATITCLNVRLHRTGRRIDPMWENFALVAPSMFARAEALLAAEAA